MCVCVCVCVCVCDMYIINYNQKESREITIEEKLLKITIIIITLDKMDIISY